MVRSTKVEDFSLEDFRRQLQRFAKPGLLTKLFYLLPGMRQFRELLNDADSLKETFRLIGIIDSMTRDERRNPKIIVRSRQHRIAQGAGVRPTDVRQLVRQFEVMKPLVDGIAGKSNEERNKWIQDYRRDGMDDPDAPASR